MGYEYGDAYYLGNDTNPYVILYKAKDSVTSCVIPDGCGFIYQNAFSATSVTSVTMPDTITEIGDSAFANCKSLKSVTLSKNLAYIEDAAFKSCTVLASVYIPISVTSIGEDCFRDCKSITIYCAVSDKPSGWDSHWAYGITNIFWGYTPN